MLCSRMNAWMLRVCVPLLAVALVAADVEVRIGKQRGHLAEELVQELEGALAGGIHGRSP